MEIADKIIEQNIKYIKEHEINFVTLISGRRIELDKPRKFKGLYELECFINQYIEDHKLKEDKTYLFH